MGTPASNSMSIKTDNKMSWLRNAKGGKAGKKGSPLLDTALLIFLPLTDLEIL
jgi:hypothetical protein